MIDYDTYFFRIADAVSLRSTCPSRQVGCVVVNPETKAIVTTGYNGAPRSTAHCGPECLERRSGTDWHLCKSVHAEMNAIANAALNGVSTKGCVMYLPTTCCLACARVVINAGITHIYAQSIYVHDDALFLLKEAGVGISIISGVEGEL